MSKAWIDIVSTDIDGKSPITETLLGKFFDNQEALISTPVDTYFEEVLAVGSGTTIAAPEVFIPPQVNTAGGDVTLVVRFEAMVSSGTGEVEAQLASGSWVSSGTFTNTSYGYKTITITSADVKAAQDTAAVLTFRVKSGSANVDARCISMSSRLERAV
jgi:hypothetical protein